EEAFSKSLLEECISSMILFLKVKMTTQRTLVRMSQSKHILKNVQEYLRMVGEVTIDKENLDYLNHHETFYMCEMTDNLQYWMIVVEKESFVVCCENGGLPSHNTLSSLQFFKITHHNIASICLSTATLMMGPQILKPQKKNHTLFFELKKKKLNSMKGTFHYGKSVGTVDESDDRYLEKFCDSIIFSKEKGNIVLEKVRL
ncbi:hypothetical protein RFI_36539, partial [Reticulomyxa filosa]